ncbi:hypothetical protein BU15DRAFT_78352 [Melanogaster broomeanus]|nr:hypothetical protein BU15DRAFT_78352 [Melanogaster broomeanus]
MGQPLDLAKLNPMGQKPGYWSSLNSPMPAQLLISHRLFGLGPAADFNMGPRRCFLPFFELPNLWVPITDLRQNLHPMGPAADLANSPMGPAAGIVDSPMGPAADLANSPMGPAAVLLDSPMGPVANLANSPMGPAAGIIDSPMGPAADLANSPMGPAADLAS